MATPLTFVIIGAGLAGAKAAEALRNQGFEGRVILLGEEAERPYERPPLSKDYLQGKVEKDKIYVHPQGWYAEHDIELRLDQRVASIDRDTRQVIAQDGARTAYDKLLIATGSVPRRLRIAGADLDGVLYLRKVQDSDAIKAAFKSAARAVIIGAGWIGLETAAAARAANVEATVLERSLLPLLGVLGPEMAQIYADLHTRHGVDLRTQVQVDEIVGDGRRATGVCLVDGTQLDADVVIVGVGITPDAELAEAAAITVDNGIVVDEHLRTNDPDVFAAGDVANVYYPSLGHHLRLEHWSAALNQGPVAAANMLGNETAYDHMPYFYSDQYDMGMEYWGYAKDYDQVVFRGDVAKGEYIVFWLGGRSVRAGMNVNIWDAGDAISALVRSPEAVDTDRLANPDIPLEDLLGGG